MIVNVFSISASILPLISIEVHFYKVDRSNDVLNNVKHMFPLFDIHYLLYTHQYIAQSTGCTKQWNTNQQIACLIYYRHIYITTLFRSILINTKNLLSIKL